jgi:hypothetical protein
MTPIDATMYPPVIAIGDGYRKRAAFAYDHKGSQGCCITALVAAYEACELNPAQLFPCACGRGWAHAAGQWRIVGTVPDKRVRGGRVLAIANGTDFRIRGRAKR